MAYYLSNIFLVSSLVLLFYTDVIKCLPRIHKHWKSRNIKDGQNFYPITASWFADRFSKDEWMDTLKQFQSIGGDTVVLRAPEMLIRTPDDIRKDPNFHWCGSSSSPAGLGPPDCVTEAETELKLRGLNVTGFATYQYEEDFSGKIMCGNLDRMINSSRIYYRLVLPVKNASLGSCSFKPGDEVLVLFTSFAGTDPHDLLIQTAMKTGNISVYFGHPAAPKSESSLFQTTYLHAYYQFVYRVLRDHAYRYNSRKTLSPDTKLKLNGDKSNVKDSPQMQINKEADLDEWEMKQKDKDSLSPLIGYYGTDEACLAELSKGNIYVEMYKMLGSLTKLFHKQFMVSPFIILNRSQGNYTLQNHVQGFEVLASTGSIDIIAIQEGRGCAKGCYYFDNQIDMPVAQVDPGLDKIIRYLDPKVPSGVTFRQQFTGSNNELFRLFGEARDNLHKEGVKFEYWLNVEAFEYMRDDPCLPVDSQGSGMAELLDRTTKSRVDWALSIAGLYVHKVISFAWDSDFTCTSQKQNQSLVMDIYRDADRPIIMYCGWHSKNNMSVVLIGHRILGTLTQGYQVEYQTREGATKKEFVYPYYVEGDWGPVNNRVPSLVYTQLYDVMDPYDVSRNGTVTVSASNVHHPCVFTYDFR